MTKHLYPVWALRTLVRSFETHAPRYQHHPGYVEKRIAQIEAAIKVLEADTDQKGIRLRDLPKWKARQEKIRQSRGFSEAMLNDGAGMS